MNQWSCNLAVVVVAASSSRHVIVGDNVPVVAPSALIRNCGSYGVAAGIGGALRHGPPPRYIHTPAMICTRPSLELSQYSSTGSGSVAATKIANRAVEPALVSFS